MPLLFSQLALALIQYCCDNLIHIVVFILAQTAAEDDLLLGFGQLLVFGVECAVLGIIHRIVRLIAGLPLGGVLTADDGLGQVVAVFILAELKPLVLNDTGPRRLTVGVVDRGIALEARLVQQLILKADRAVFQRAQLIVKVSVNGASVDYLVSQRIQFSLVLQIIRIQAHLDAVQQVGNHLGVAADGDALIQRVEIVVVKGQPHRQALDDKSRQVLAVAAPLLFGVALDELLINVAAYKGDGLLLKVLRLVGDLTTLLLNFGGCLLRCDDAPQFY